MVNPFDDLKDFFTVLDNINTSFHGGLGGSGMRFGSSTRSSGGFVPAVDIYEDDDGYKLIADLPGCSTKDVDLKVHDRELCLSATRTIPYEGTAYNRERRSGHFERCWTFPASIAEDKVTADLNSGVLEVKFPVSKLSQHRNIDIKG